MRAILGAALFTVAVAAPKLCLAADTPPTLAVADFEYVDTSGEVRDQTQQHATLLRMLSDGLGYDLQMSGVFQVVVLSCARPECTAEGADPARLIASAKAAGATRLLLGSVHKMSTLVQFAQLRMLDVASGKPVFDRLYTFRGDTDEAWRHAEQFMARDVEKVGRDGPR